MIKKSKTTALLLTFLIITASINSCKKEEQAKGIDKEMYDLSKTTNGFTWYKNSSALLNKSAGSGHPQPFLTTRYNAIAASQLDANGKIKLSAIFPEGSLIVKELIDNASNIERYAILYKKSTSAEADAKGWVWGYINADGTVSEPASKKGVSCISCHSQADNIEYMLMNKYFP